MITSKIPIHLALRLCLESTSVDEAVKTLEACGSVASSAHILLADSTKAIGMELSPVGNVYLPQDKETGIVTHSNHFIENRYADERSRPWQPGSSIRLTRIRELWTKMSSSEKLPSAAGDDGLEAALRERIFSDTFNAPGAICCQEDPKRPFETRSSTLFNIIMSLRSGKPSAQVVWGQPGSGKEGEVLSMPW